MDLSESKIHSFIVKLWLDSVAEEAGRAVWQGHITHVPGGERRHFRDLDEIRDFIEPYVEAEGVPVVGGGKVRRWLRRWRLRSI